MKSSAQQNRTAAKLLADTGSASMAVMGSRMLSLANPVNFMSARQHREVSTMVSEKVQAGVAGWWSAAAEASMIPYRLFWSSPRADLFTPSGYARMFTDSAALWMGVGNAALTPARNTVVRNRSRLAR